MQENTQVQQVGRYEIYGAHWPPKGMYTATSHNQTPMAFGKGSKTQSMNTIRLI